MTHEKNGSFEKLKKSEKSNFVTFITSRKHFFTNWITNTEQIFINLLHTFSYKGLPLLFFQTLLYII